LAATRQKYHINELKDDTQKGHSELQKPAAIQSATAENKIDTVQSQKPLKEKLTAAQEDAPKPKQVKNLKQSHKQRI